MDPFQETPSHVQHKSAPGGGVGQALGITAAKLPEVGGTRGYHPRPKPQRALSGGTWGYHPRQKIVVYLHTALNYCFGTCTHNTSR